MSAKPFLQEEVPVIEAIARVLEEAGVEMVFGIPGGNTVRIYKGLYEHQSKIRAVLVRQETLAGVMAEVYGRLTGKLSVAMGQGAFMLSNALLGTVEAHTGCAPMLLFTDFSDGAPFSHHAPYQAGTGDYRTWDAKAAFGAVTKETFCPHGPGETVQSVQLAIKHAMTGERGPVAVVFHSTALGGTVGPDSVPRLYSTESYLPPPPPPADPSLVEAAAQALLSANSPTIIAGNGVRVSRAYDQLQELAELIGAPVATTAGGKGVFAENHDLALGVCGNFGQRVANLSVGQADTIFAVGTKLAPSDTIGQKTELLDPTRQTFIQLDIEPKNASWTFPCDHVVIGDAAVALGQIIDCIRDLGAPAASVVEARAGRLMADKKDYGFFEPPEASSEVSPLYPQRIIAELRRGIDDDTIVTCDAGENRLFMTHWFQTRKAGTILMPSATGAMGYALPAALAAKLAFPERRVIAVSGDGGFPMAMNGLITACEEKIPITQVIFNNSRLGWVSSGMGDTKVASEFSDVNYAEISKSMGCVGIRVDNPGELEQALKDTEGSEETVVIDVLTSTDFTFRDVSSQF